MKNVRSNQLKTCIFLTDDEYTDILKSIFGDDIQIEFSMDGIWVGYDDPTCEEPDVEEKLAEYFDVAEITNIHMDDCDAVGIWICYKET